jgi:hypothetical protein
MTMQITNGICAAAFFLLMSGRGAAIAEPIDRPALVSRHDVQVHEIDPWSPLSVGNGDFAFTVDATGLQSFPDLYFKGGIPTETLSSLPWAWHSFPNAGNVRREDAEKEYPFHGRTIRYDSMQGSPAGKYFRENPQPLPLGQLGFIYKGAALKPEAIGKIAQRLDLWSGVIYSAFTLDGQLVAVETLAHPDQSLIAVKIASPLLKDGSLEVCLRFPYAYNVSAGKNKPPLIWDQPDQHQTTLRNTNPSSVRLERAVDSSRYAVTLSWEEAARFTSGAAHEFRLVAEKSDSLAFTCGFSGTSDHAPEASFKAAKQASADAWERYWQKGGAVDLSECTAPRARELERRIVLSQYLVKVNYAGSFPPAETGLTHLSWYGKHNSEMYFWHGAQFHQWGRTDLLEKGLAWYQKILPVAKGDASSKGFEGARWPKMAGIDGQTTPGGINPFIIWNFPNPIYLSELVYRAHPERATLEKYRDLVFENAKFLASYAYYDEATGRYVLGPPLQSVSENSDANKTQNPTFELAYWYYGLKLAQTWRERLGLKPEPHWADIIAKLSKLPVVKGKYVDVETEPDLFERKKVLPSSMLMALGFLPQTPMVDPEIMRATFREICARNGMEHWYSWAMGKAAMTAARLGEPEKAVEILTNEAPPARFMNNGHVRRPKEMNTCVAFLPVNASLLSAVALMAAGWDGAPKVAAPGFPQDGTWKVKWEGLQPMP